MENVKYQEKWENEAYAERRERERKLIEEREREEAKRQPGL